MTPDVMGTLPAIRFVLAAPISEGRMEVRSSNIHYQWRAGEQVATCHHAFAHYSAKQAEARMGEENPHPGWGPWYGGGPKPPEHPDQPAPLVECSCGFYGWYPWVREERRWYYGGLTCAPNEGDEPAKLHPALAQIVQWIVGGSIVTFPVAVVVDMTGSVVLHDTGVRAGRATPRAVIGPDADVVIPVGYRQQLNRLERKALDLKHRTLSYWTKKVADQLEVSLITPSEALALEDEWDVVRQRITDGDQGGGLR